MGYAEYQRTWRRRNPNKVAAYTAINHAVRHARLEKQPCEVCASPHAHAHHTDYSKPLEVRWLCPAHHEREHHTYEPPYTRKPTVWPYTKKYQPSPKRDALLSEARCLRDSGMSYRQIAAELGIGVGTIYRWLNPKPNYH